MNPREPYSLFFPLGLLCGFIGVILWIPWLSGHHGTYPGQVHPDLMVGGFLLFYTLGFLTTAIPRFTGTSMMSPREKKIALGLVAVLFLGFLSRLRGLVLATELGILLFLAVFAFRRVSQRKVNPPPTFAFIGIGIVLGLIGILLQFVIEMTWVDVELLAGSKALFYLGYTLSLILGIGSRLLPALMGHQPVPVPMPPLNSERLLLKEFLRLIPRDLLATAAFFAISFTAGFLQTLPLSVGDASRALVSLWIANKYWQVYKIPKRRGVLPYFLWIASWILVLSQFGMALGPEIRLHAFHLLAISGMGLMTIMISTRVTLSHSGQGLDAETSSKALLGTGILILLAALSRFLGAFDLVHYEAYLLGASLLWCTGLLVWALRFARFWSIHPQQQIDKK